MKKPPSSATSSENFEAEKGALGFSRPDVVPSLPSCPTLPRQLVLCIVQFSSRHSSFQYGLWWAVARVVAHRGVLIAAAAALTPAAVEVEGVVATASATCHAGHRLSYGPRTMNAVSIRGTMTTSTSLSRATRSTV